LLKGTRYILVSPPQSL